MSAYFRSVRNLFDRQFWSPVVNQYYEMLTSRALALSLNASRLREIARAAWVLSRRTAGRAKTHHIYFALAFFDLAAVGTGLYLNHRLNQTLAISTGINSSLDSRFAEIDSFRQSVNAIVEIGHNASYGKSTEKDLALYKAAAGQANAKLSAFLPSLLQFTQEFAPFLRADSHGYEALAHALIVEAIGQIAIQRTGVVLSSHERGNMTPGGLRSAEMLQFHSRFLRETDTLSRMLRITETELQSAQVAEGKSLQSLEYLIGFMMVFMVCAVTLYGHQLGKIFQVKHDELKSAHDDALRAEAATRALNDEVTNLNVELANSILRLRDAQDEIVKKGKLAQLGQLIATVAHEIRNPLGAIKTSTQLLERKLKDPSLGLDKALERINKGVVRCDHIITELLDFARTQSLRLETREVDAWVRAAINEETGSLPGVVQSSFEPGLGETCALFDESSMRRVLVQPAVERFGGDGRQG